MTLAGCLAFCEDAFDNDARAGGGEELGTYCSAPVVDTAGGERCCYASSVCDAQGEERAHAIFYHQDPQGPFPLLP